MVSGGSVRLRKAIVVIQVALSLLLLIGAGLFVRSLSNLLAQDPGFEPANLVGSTWSRRLNGYESDKTKRLASTLIERIAATPGIAAVGVSGRADSRRRIVEQHACRSMATPPKPGEPVISLNHVVMPGYFTAMRIPLLRDRDSLCTMPTGARRRGA